MCPSLLGNEKPSNSHKSIRKNSTINRNPYRKILSSIIQHFKQPRPSIPATRINRKGSPIQRKKSTNRRKPLWKKLSLVIINN